MLLLLQCVMLLLLLQYLCMGDILNQSRILDCLFFVCFCMPVVRFSSGLQSARKSVCCHTLSATLGGCCCRWPDNPNKCRDKYTILHTLHSQGCTGKCCNTCHPFSECVRPLPTRALLHSNRSATASQHTITARHHSTPSQHTITARHHSTASQHTITVTTQVH